MLKNVLFSVAFLASSSTIALAQAAQDFRLVNRTGYQIDQVYVGPVSSKSWGKDVLGENAIAVDAGTNIRFSGRSETCNWDIKVVYDDGDESEFRNVNLCSTNKVTLFWNKAAGETRFVVE